MTYEVALNALGDPTRRLVFNKLCAGPCSVAALSEGLPVSRPAVSQHLKILKDAGLVTGEAMGVRRIYRVDREGLAGLRAWLDRFWDDAGDACQTDIRNQIGERQSM